MEVHFTNTSLNQKKKKSLYSQGVELMGSVVVFLFCIFFYMCSNIISIMCFIFSTIVTEKKM